MSMGIRPWASEVGDMLGFGPHLDFDILHFPIKSLAKKVAF